MEQGEQEEDNNSLEALLGEVDAALLFPTSGSLSKTSNEQNEPHLSHEKASHSHRQEIDGFLNELDEILGETHSQESKSDDIVTYKSTRETIATGTMKAHELCTSEKETPTILKNDGEAIDARAQDLLNWLGSNNDKQKIENLPQNEAGGLVDTRSEQAGSSDSSNTKSCSSSQLSLGNVEKSTATIECIRHRSKEENEGERNANKQTKVFGDNLIDDNTVTSSSTATHKDSFDPLDTSHSHSTSLSLLELEETEDEKERFLEKETEDNDERQKKRIAILQDRQHFLDLLLKELKNIHCNKSNSCSSPKDLKVTDHKDTTDSIRTSYQVNGDDKKDHTEPNHDQQEKESQMNQANIAINNAKERDTGALVEDEILELQHNVRKLDTESASKLQLRSRLRTLCECFQGIPSSLRGLLWQHLLNENEILIIEWKDWYLNREQNQSYLPRWAIESLQREAIIIVQQEQINEQERSILKEERRKRIKDVSYIPFIDQQFDSNIDADLTKQAKIIEDCTVFYCMTVGVQYHPLLVQIFFHLFCLEQRAKQAEIEMLLETESLSVANLTQEDKILEKDKKKYRNLLHFKETEQSSEEWVLRVGQILGKSHSLIAALLPFLHMDPHGQNFYLQNLHSEFRLLVAYHAPALVLHLDRQIPGWEGYALTSQAPNEEIEKKEDIDKSEAIKDAWLVGGFLGSLNMLSSQKIFVQHVHATDQEFKKQNDTSSEQEYLWDLLLLRGDRFFVLFLSACLVLRERLVLLALEGSVLKKAILTLFNLDSVYKPLKTFTSVNVKPKKDDESLKKDKNASKRQMRFEIPGGKDKDNLMEDTTPTNRYLSILRWCVEADKLDRMTPLSFRVNLVRIEEIAKGRERSRENLTPRSESSFMFAQNLNHKQNEEKGRASKGKSIETYGLADTNSNLGYQSPYFKGKEENQIESLEKESKTDRPLNLESPYTVLQKDPNNSKIPFNDKQLQLDGIEKSQNRQWHFNFLSTPKKHYHINNNSTNSAYQYSRQKGKSNSPPFMPSLGRFFSSSPGKDASNLGGDFEQSNTVLKLCMAIAPEDLLPQLCTSRRESYEKIRQEEEKARLSNNKPQYSIFHGGSQVLFFPIDCRPIEHLAYGRFPTAFHMDPRVLTDIDGHDAEKHWLETLGAVKGQMHLVLMGTGDRSGYVPQNGTVKALQVKEALRRSAKEDIEHLSHVALYLIKKNFPYVSILQGGFVTAHNMLMYKRLSYTLASLVDHVPSHCRMCRYEALMRFQLQTKQEELEKKQKKIMESNQKTREIHSVPKSNNNGTSSLSTFGNLGLQYKKWLDGGVNISPTKLKTTQQQMTEMGGQNMNAYSDRYEEKIGPKSRVTGEGTTSGMFSSQLEKLADPNALQQGLEQIQAKASIFMDKVSDRLGHSSSTSSHDADNVTSYSNTEVVSSTEKVREKENFKASPSDSEESTSQLFVNTTQTVKDITAPLIDEFKEMTTIFKTGLFNDLGDEKNNKDNNNVAQNRQKSVKNEEHTEDGLNTTTCHDDKVRTVSEVKLSDPKTRNIEERIHNQKPSNTNMFIIGGDDEEESDESDGSEEGNVKEYEEEDEKHDRDSNNENIQDQVEVPKSDEYLETSDENCHSEIETREERQLRDERQSTRTRTTSAERERALQIHRFNGLQKAEKMFLSSQNLPNATLFFVDKIKTHMDLNGEPKTTVALPRIIAITSERIIVFEQQDEVGICKSNHHLTELIKMTFMKRNPNMVNIFFRTDDVNNLKKKQYIVERKEDFIALIQSHLQKFR